MKNNSERIYRKSFVSMISDGLLDKDKEWIKEHGRFLSDEEKSLVEYLDSIREVSISINEGKDKEETEKEKVEKLFNELEEHLDEQKSELLKLKVDFIKKKY